MGKKGFFYSWFNTLPVRCKLRAAGCRQRIKQFHCMFSNNAIAHSKRMLEILLDLRSTTRRLSICEVRRTRNPKQKNPKRKKTRNGQTYHNGQFLRPYKTVAILLEPESQSGLRCGPESTGTANAEWLFFVQKEELKSSLCIQAEIIG